MRKDNQMNKMMEFLANRKETKVSNYKARKVKKVWVFSCVMTIVFGAQTLMATNVFANETDEQVQTTTINPEIDVEVVDDATDQEIETEESVDTLKEQTIVDESSSTQVTTDSVEQEQSQVAEITPFAVETLAIRRIDGLYTGSETLTFYIEGSEGATISSISVYSDAENYGSWPASYITDLGGGYYQVSFTSPTLISYVGNPSNVGKMLNFRATFNTGTTPTYSQAIDGSELVDAKNVAKDTIDALNYLSTEQKETYKNQVQYANSVDEVYMIVDEAIMDDARLERITQLNEKATEVIHSITNDINATTDQKNTAIAEVASILNTAIKDINKEFETSEMDIIKDQAIEDMEKVFTNLTSLTDQAKADAKKEIEEAGNTAKEAIDNLPNLTGGEKETAKNAIDEEVSKGKEVIDTNETIAEVDESKEDTLTAIDNIVKEGNEKNRSEQEASDQAKADAKKEIEEAGNTAKEAIDNLPNLTDGEKETAKNAIDEEVSKGKEVIDTNETISEVDESKEDTLTAIDNIVKEGKETNDQKQAEKEALDQAKADAKKEIEEAGNTAKEAINNLPNLTDTEKETAKNAIDEEVSKGKEAIDNSKTISEVDEIEDNTLTEIDNIVKNVNGKDTSEQEPIESVVAGVDDLDNQVKDSSSLSSTDSGTQSETQSETESEKTVSATTNINNSSTAKKYPQTGEKATGMISVLGLMMMLIGTWVVFRRKKDETK